MTETKQPRHPNVSQPSCSDAEWKRLERDYGSKMLDYAKRYEPCPQSAEAIAAESVEKFVRELSSGKSAAKSALEKGEELRYLYVIVKNKCIDSFRSKTKEKKRNQIALEIRDGLSANTEEKFDKLTFQFAATLQLDWNQRRVVQAQMGWDKADGDCAPLGHGEQKVAAEKLGLSVKEYRRHWDSAKKELADRADVFKVIGEDVIANALRTLADEERPGCLGFANPFFREVGRARYALRIVDLAASKGIARVSDLLRALEQCDFLGDPDAAPRFLTALQAMEQFETAEPVLRADVFTATAVLFDHMAAKAEREGDLQTAKRLIVNGLNSLDHICPEAHDPATMKLKYVDRYPRVLHHRGILDRRQYETVGQIQASYDARLLRRASDLFYQVMITADRADQRISAMHQLAVADLLKGNLDDADAKLNLNIAGWETLVNLTTDPAKKAEYLFRSAYEHRRLADVSRARMTLAMDASERADWFEQASAQLDEAEMISHRWGNLRYVYELCEERRKLEALYHEPPAAREA